MSRKYIVYMHTTPSDKRYIGITMQKPETRWNKGLGYQKQSYFYRAIVKYGWDNIKNEILYNNLSKCEAEELEITLIKKFKCTDRSKGYNIANGGETIGTHSESSKIKMSISHRGELNPMYGVVSPMKGGKHSEETRRKISIKAKERYANSPHPMQGRKHSKESKLKMSKAPRPSGEAHHMYRKTHTKEARAKIAKSKNKKVRNITTGEVYDSAKLGAEAYGMTRQNVSSCCRGIYKSAGNHPVTGVRMKWEYV